MATDAFFDTRRDADYRNGVMIEGNSGGKYRIDAESDDGAHCPDEAFTAIGATARMLLSLLRFRLAASGPNGYQCQAGV